MLRQRCARCSPRSGSCSRAAASTAPTAAPARRRAPPAKSEERIHGQGRARRSGPTRATPAPSERRLARTAVQHVRRRASEQQPVGDSSGLPSSPRHPTGPVRRVVHSRPAVHRLACRPQLDAVADLASSGMTRHPARPPRRRRPARCARRRPPGRRLAPGRAAAARPRRVARAARARAGRRAAARPRARPFVVAAADLAAGVHAARRRPRRPRAGPPSSCPAGALADPAAADGRVLVGAARAGEPITDVRLAGAGRRLGGPDGAAAVPVRLADAGVAGAAGPGQPGRRRRGRRAQRPAGRARRRRPASSRCCRPTPTGSPRTAGAGRDAARGGGAGGGRVAGRAGRRYPPLT